jgi:hypothetical protein
LLNINTLVWPDPRRHPISFYNMYQAISTCPHSQHLSVARPQAFIPLVNLLKMKQKKAETPQQDEIPGFPSLLAFKL